MIKESEIRQLLINAGFTFSAEAGEDYPMRNIPLGQLTSTIVDFLHRNHVGIAREEKYLGKGKRSYYLARANLARQAGNLDLAKSYELLVGALPLEDNHEQA